MANESGARGVAGRIHRSGGTAMTFILVALFDRPGDAEQAADDLPRALGTDPQELALFGDTPVPRARAMQPIDRLHLPSEEDFVFRQGIRRGGTVLAAWLAEGQTDAAMAVFARCGAADLEMREETWRNEAPTDDPEVPGRRGYTGHDEDIGYATYGGDAVLGPIPRRHQDDAPAGLLGRFAMSAMQRDPERSRAHARAFAVTPRG
jgi:hypothetical protein